MARSTLRIVEHAVAGGRHIRAVQHLFAEDLTSLELGSGLRRPENHQLLFAQSVCEPGNQGSLRADNRQTDLFLLDELDDRCGVADLERNVLSILGGSGVSRCHKRTTDLGALS